MAASYRVPFNRPSFSEQAHAYLAAALLSGHAAGDGSFTARCHSLLEELLGVPRALLTTNCTHALEMSALLLDLTPGDEVIMPSFTFVSTANAFALRGARPIFVDIRPDTLN
ncbi:MAG: aminotransferase class I/II-fold pyridoxal phosphate-dependent enzyme, partial [Chloroflexota bacterium]|nr:aminotransferase class I/II-fold pyridoxal phosphate-dependent enzyme [Chloroflexota bacterium]